jgi:hypothetical protein
MTTTRVIATLAVAFALTAPAPALAGPGSLPPYLLPPRAEDRGDAPYALTGRAGDETRLRARMAWVGGARDRRIVYERVDRDDD